MDAKTSLKSKKDQVFISRINGRLKAAIARAAESDGKTMTDYVEQLVKADLSKRGLTIENEKV